MRGVVKLGDKEVEMLSNAMTPYRYKQVFDEDLLKLLWGANESDDDIASVECITKLAYIMRGQAMGKGNELSIDGFFEFIENIEMFDCANAAQDILGLCMNTFKTKSTSKKKTVR